jgi:hypothetical protein
MAVFPFQLPEQNRNGLKPVVGAMGSVLQKIIEDLSFVGTGINTIALRLAALPDDPAGEQVIPLILGKCKW